MQVAIWYAWVFRKQVLIYLLTLVKDASDVPASKPQAATPGVTCMLPSSPPEQGIGSCMQPLGYIDRVFIAAF